MSNNREKVKKFNKVMGKNNPQSALLQHIFTDEAKDLSNTHGSKYRYCRDTKQSYHIDFYSTDHSKQVPVPHNIEKKIKTDCYRLMSKFNIENSNFKQFENTRDCFFEPYKYYIEDYEFGGYLKEICDKRKIRDILIINIDDSSEGADEELREKRKSKNHSFSKDSAQDHDSLKNNDMICSSYLNSVEKAAQRYLKCRKNNPTRTSQIIKQLIGDYKNIGNPDYAKKLFILVAYAAEEYKAALAVNVYKTAMKELFSIDKKSINMTFSDVNSIILKIMETRAKSRIVEQLANLNIDTNMDRIDRQVGIIAGTSNPLYIFDRAFNRSKEILEKLEKSNGKNIIETWIGFMMMKYISEVVTILDLTDIIWALNPHYMTYLVADWDEFSKLMLNKSLLELITETSDILKDWKACNVMKYYVDINCRSYVKEPLDPNGFLYNLFSSSFENSKTIDVTKSYK